MKYITAFILCVFLAICAHSCKSTQVVGNTSHEIEQHVTIDSVNFFRDRWHYLYIKGDTIWRYDSVYIDRSTNKTDTIYKDVQNTVTIEVPAELSKWQKFVQGLGYTSMGIVLAFIIFFILSIFKKIN
ncbi:MAG: hypothetical protein NC346_09055 [Prevotella sp.]|nr:hypothetical protein [Prevotella sp.]MCM1443670.1 hypothetical protein [Muribaculum sp.]MCM1577147.1 hypothetical protein [Bacteroides sp.]